MKTPTVYDKAKYHSKTVKSLGLPRHHAYHHATFYFSWLIRKGMIDSEYEELGHKIFAKYRAGKIHINKVYEFFDYCLVSDMLTDEGNAFTSAYFNFQNGNYLKDYFKYLKKNLQSEYMVQYTPENEALIHAVIDRRYRQWKKKWWQFWK